MVRQLAPISLSLVLFAAWCMGALLMVLPIHSALLFSSAVTFGDGLPNQAFAGRLRPLASAWDQAAGECFPELATKESMTWGIIWPQVLLPADAASRGRRRLHVVLLHELRATSNITTRSPSLFRRLHCHLLVPPACVAGGAAARSNASGRATTRCCSRGTRASDYAEELLSLVATRGSRLPPARSSGDGTGRPVASDFEGEHESQVVHAGSSGFSPALGYRRNSRVGSVAGAEKMARLKIALDDRYSASESTRSAGVTGSIVLCKGAFRHPASARRFSLRKAAQAQYR